MSFEYQIQRKGHELLLGFSTDDSILDILTTVNELIECQKLIEENQGTSKVTFAKIGRFGEFPITLNVQGNVQDAQLFIDGPAFDNDRTQSASITVNKNILLNVLKEIIGASKMN